MLASIYILERIQIRRQDVNRLGFVLVVEVHHVTARPIALAQHCAGFAIESVRIWVHAVDSNASSCMGPLMRESWATVHLECVRSRILNMWICVFMCTTGAVRICSVQ